MLRLFCKQRNVTMPKSNKPTAGRRRSPPALCQRLVLGDHAIHAEEILQIPERRPTGAGAWQHEPDRVAWRDAASGYSCLILRQPSGALAGYVAVGPEHPLWGYQADAIPTELGLTAHRGLTYSATCQENAPPRLRICHPHDSMRLRGGEQPHVPDHKDSAASGASNAWWFGFACEHAGDLMPRSSARNNHRREDGPPVYRDLAYVAAQTLSLARQLKALEEESARLSASLPTAGMLLLLENKSASPSPRKGGSDV
jgi:hypothetical protein